MGLGLGPGCLDFKRLPGQLPLAALWALVGTGCESTEMPIAARRVRHMHPRDWAAGMRHRVYAPIPTTEHVAEFDRNRFDVTIVVSEQYYRASAWWQVGKKASHATSQEATSYNVLEGGQDVGSACSVFALPSVPTRETAAHD
jgi:hypothetical protein